MCETNGAGLEEMLDRKEVTCVLDLDDAVAGRATLSSTLDEWEICGVENNIQKGSASGTVSIVELLWSEHPDI
jgi:hypothetical protein